MHALENFSPKLPLFGFQRKYEGKKEREREKWQKQNTDGGSATDLPGEPVRGRPPASASRGRCWAAMRGQACSASNWMKRDLETHPPSGKWFDQLLLKNTMAALLTFFFPRKFKFTENNSHYNYVESYWVLEIFLYELSVCPGGGKLNRTFRSHLSMNLLSTYGFLTSLLGSLGVAGTCSFHPTGIIQSTFPVTQMIKSLPAIQETRVWTLGQEDPLGKGRATHSSFLACRFPWTEEPGRPQSMGSQRVRPYWGTNITTALYIPSKESCQSVSYWNNDVALKKKKNPGSKFWLPAVSKSLNFLVWDELGVWSATTGCQVQTWQSSKILASCFCKRPDNKYFRLCGPHSLWHDD